MTNHPAAFINAIAEEGTKAEAVEWLQKQWNENCELREAVTFALKRLGELNRDDESGIRIVLANALKTAEGKVG